MAFSPGRYRGGTAAALMGLLVAFPSFKTRGDYLAIVTLAFGMIVKSVIENIDCPRRAPRLSGHGESHNPALGILLEFSPCG